MYPLISHTHINYNWKLSLESGINIYGAKDLMKFCVGVNTINVY